MKKSVSLSNDVGVMDQIAAVVVIYNQKITESISYQSIAENRVGILPFIVDNSTDVNIRNFNTEFIKENKLNHISMGKNLGISKAYNLAVQEISNTFAEIRFIVTLDQDTYINGDYFREIHSLSKINANGLVYCPKVITRTSNFSPRSIHGALCKGIDSQASVTSVTTAINSGLVWNLEAFIEVHYDERLFLDMVDFDIFFQLYKLGLKDKIHFMNVEIKQDFSGETFSTQEKDIKRYRMYIQDLDTFCKKWKVSHYYCFYLKLKRCLRLSVGHRSFSFLVELVSHTFHKT